MPYGPYPYGPHGAPAPRPQPFPPEAALPLPVAVEPVPGTPYSVAVVGVAPTTSGPAAASLAAGIGSILVSFVVGCFAAAGAGAGWGPIVSGAFAVLATLAGVAAVLLGRVGRRQTRPAPVVSNVAEPPVQGRGLATSGIVCGVVGLVLTALAMLVAVLLV